MEPPITPSSLAKSQDNTEKEKTFDDTTDTTKAVQNPDDDGPEKQAPDAKNRKTVNHGTWTPRRL
eukprot:11910803-Prorocentrum_lima.AAC.1